MVNVLYCANDKHLKMVFLSCLSMAKKTKESITVYLMTLSINTKKRNFNAISVQQANLLRDTLKKYNNQSDVVLIDMKDLFNQYLDNNKNSESTYSPYALLRLLSPHVDILPSRLIYLDTDTMVNNDINELYNYDLANNEIGLVQDAMGHYFFGKNYCNSGVLLLDLDKIKESKLFDRCIEYVVTKKRFMPDQDAINYCSNAKLVLPRRFNEQRDIKQDTVVKHFCKVLKFLPYMHTVNIKQYEIDKVHKILKIHEFDDVFEEYNKIKEENGDLLF